MQLAGIDCAYTARACGAICKLRQGAGYFAGSTVYTKPHLNELSAAVGDVEVLHVQIVRPWAALVALDRGRSP